jgi:hypothetical protein
MHDAKSFAAEAEGRQRDISQRLEAVGQVIKLTTVMTITAVID